MKRREFVSGLALAAGATACSQQPADCGPADTPSRETFEWNLVTSWPPGLPGLGVGVEVGVKVDVGVGEGTSATKAG